MKKLFAFLAVSLVCVVFSPVVFASEIRGQVFDSSGAPVKEVWVELMNEVDALQGRARTDGSGRYLFRGLSNGTFMVRVPSSGVWVEQVKRIDLTPPMPGANRQTYEIVDFHMKRLDEAAGGEPSGTLFAQDVPPAARTAFDEGIAALPSSPDGGMAKLKQAIDLFPDYYAALEKYGVESVKRNDYEGAIPVLAKAVQVNPKGSQAFFALGVAQYQLKKMVEAAESLDHTLLLSPNSPNAPFAHYYRGMALVKTGKPVEAEKHLAQAASQKQGQKVPSDVHMALAQIYGNSKRYKEAVAELETFLKETPDAADKDRIQQVIQQLKQRAR